jgi:hypothetical protein
MDLGPHDYDLLSLLGGQLLAQQASTSGTTTETSKKNESV